MTERLSSGRAGAVIGIDPSLRTTGVAISRRAFGETTLELVTLRTMPHWDTLQRILRTPSLIDELLCDVEHIELVVIEGLSYCSRGRSIVDIGGLWWAIRLMLATSSSRYHVPVIVIPPARLKQFATGRGNAEKSLIMREIWRQWKVEAEDEHQADAAVLAIIGEGILGRLEDATVRQIEIIGRLRREYSELLSQGATHDSTSRSHTTCPHSP